MKLQKLGERDLIAFIRQEFAGRGKGIVLGIGDDAAVLKPGKKCLILTKDLLFEDVDFRRRLHPPFLLGRKSLNVNLSDVAAMGGKPLFALLGFGLPPDVKTSWLEDFLSGFKSAAEETGVSLIGGDISRAKEIAISVTIIGEGEAIIPRSGAKPGDLLFVSGFLGDAQAGFSLLERGIKLGKDRKADPLLKAFLDPVPQLDLGRELAQLKLGSAMIDTSDGLSTDLLHLCEESGVGAEIDLAKLPLSAGIRRFSKNPIRLALHGGEDFQLLFSVPPSKLPALSRFKRKFLVTAIGRMIPEKRLYTIDRRGKKRVLEIKGYEHFKKQNLGTCS